VLKTIRALNKLFVHNTLSILITLVLTSLYMRVEKKCTRLSSKLALSQ